jgi:hypothetical protein
MSSDSTLLDDNAVIALSSSRILAELDRTSKI